MDLERFTAAGLQIVVQEYEHPVYSQLYGEFASHLSALDLLCNCGPESGKVIRRGRKNQPISRKEATQ
jgi:hypothetical protein